MGIPIYWEVKYLFLEGLGGWEEINLQGKYREKIGEVEKIEGVSGSREGGEGSRTSFKYHCGPQYLSPWGYLNIL